MSLRTAVAALLFGTASLLAAVGAGPRSAIAAGMPFAITDLKPAAIPAKKAVSVQVTAKFQGTGRAPKTVLLDRVDAMGKVIGKLGSFRLSKGVYSVKVKLKEPAPGTVLVRVDTQSGKTIAPASEVAALHAFGSTSRLIQLLAAEPFEEISARADRVFTQPFSSGVQDQIDSEISAVFGAGGEPTLLGLHGPLGNPTSLSTAAVDYELDTGTESLATTAATKAILNVLAAAGVKTGILQNAYGKTSVHAEGLEAAGYMLKVGTNGLTVLSVKLIRSSKLDYTDAAGKPVRLVVYRTHHIILNTKAATDVTTKPPVDPATGQLTFGASTLVHELVHAAGYEEGCFGAADEDEAFAYGVEDLVNRRVEIAEMKKAGANTTAKEGDLVCKIAEVWQAQPAGQDCLRKLGFEPAPAELTVEPAFLDFTATSGGAATPATASFVVTATDPVSGVAVPVCVEAKRRTSDGVTLGDTKSRATPATFTFHVVTTTVDLNTGEEKPLPDGTYGDTVELRSISVAEGQPGSLSNPIRVPVRLVIGDSPPRYTLTDLGTLPGGFTSVAHGINNLGQVVGYGDAPSTTGSGRMRRAFLWTKGIGMVALGDFPSPQPPDTIPGSMAYAINDSGTVVGYASNGWEGGATIWQAGSGPVHHRTLYADGSHPAGGAYGINNSGQAVGLDWLPGADTAVRWDGLLPIRLSFGFNSRATGINDLGQVTGYADVPETSNFHATRWWNGQATDLGVLLPDGTGSSFGWAINGRGEVVGQSTAIGGAYYHGFLWSDVGGTPKMTDLDVVSGFAGFNPMANNDAGIIVGTTGPNRFTADFPTGTAVLYRKGKVYNLSTLIVPAPSPVGIQAAVGINNSGQIAAVASYGFSTPHAVLLDPVPPQSSWPALNRLRPKSSLQRR